MLVTAIDRQESIDRILDQALSDRDISEAEGLILLQQAELDGISPQKRQSAIA